MCSNLWMKWRQSISLGKWTRTHATNSRCNPIDGKGKRISDSDNGERRWKAYGMDFVHENGNVLNVLEAWTEQLNMRCASTNREKSIIHGVCFMDLAELHSLIYARKHFDVMYPEWQGNEVRRVEDEGFHEWNDAIFTDCLFSNHLNPPANRLQL